MGARLRQQRIADDAIVLRVAVGGLQRRFDIGVDLGTDGGDNFGRVSRKAVQMLAQLFARLFGIALRVHQQADGQVGQPISQLAEGDMGSGGRRRVVEQRLGFRRAVGAAVECLGQEDRRQDEADQPGRRQRGDTGGDRQIGQAMRQAATRLTYRSIGLSLPGGGIDCGSGFRGGHLNRTMLIAPPRSPALPPSFG